ncbi:MAG: sensor histidine kinase [Lachnospiraceae bacterium]
MFKTLQKKFIVTTMLIVSILIFGMVSAFNIVTYYMELRENEKTLNFIASEAERPPRKDDSPKTDLPENNDLKQQPPNQNDSRDPGVPPAQEKVLSSRFFWVMFTESGDIIDEELSQITTLTQTEAEEIAQNIYSAWQKNNTTAGTTKHLYYRVLNHKHGPGVRILFLDTTLQFYSRMMMLLVSVFIGCICWIFMLLLAIFLSKRAIRPIAENIKRQKQFVTNAGHEIKTPLAIILANTEAMELHQGESKWSKNIREQITRLTGLTQNLLSLARMDEQTDVILNDVNLSTLTETVLQPFYESTALRGILIFTEVDPGITLQANEECLRQLLSILFDNAAKYTNENGQIDVELQKNDGQISLFVKNTCEILPDAAPEKLFDRFYRGDHARTQKSGGYGIGLSVAKAIVQLHHGQILPTYEEGPAFSIQIKLPEKPPSKRRSSL